jgi:hypothetical protein
MRGLPSGLRGISKVVVWNTALEQAQRVFRISSIKMSYSEIRNKSILDLSRRAAIKISLGLLESH